MVAIVIVFVWCGGRLTIGGKWREHILAGNVGLLAGEVVFLAGKWPSPRGSPIPGTVST
jgi:hypothetical protein